MARETRGTWQERLAGLSKGRLAGLDKRRLAGLDKGELAGLDKVSGAHTTTVPHDVYDSNVQYRITVVLTMRMTHRVVRNTSVTGYICNPCLPMYQESQRPVCQPI